MTEHQEQAERLERDADELEQRSERLGGEISDAREDWERKVGDESVPGTPPAPKDSESDDDEAPWPDE